MKKYTFNFNEIAQLTGPLSSVTKHLTRMNPEEHGKGTIYSYTCKNCGSIHVIVRSISFKVDIFLDSAQLSNICPECTGLLLQLKIADF